MIGAESEATRAVAELNTTGGPSRHFRLATRAWGVLAPLQQRKIRTVDGHMWAASPCVFGAQTFYGPGLELRQDLLSVELEEAF